MLPIEYNIYEKDFNNIKKILEFVEQTKIYKRFSYNNTIWFYSKEKGTELYVKNFINQKLIISRIYLTNKRKGTCFKIVNELKKYCKKHHIKELIIESTITKEMNNFCKKNNFKPIKYEGFNIDNEFYGNYQYII